MCRWRPIVGAVAPSLTCTDLIFALWLSVLSPVCIAHKDWTNSAYPDIRGPTSQVLLCASRIPEEGLLYICDPDRIFNTTQLLRINGELEKLAVQTRCPCQRRSQCSSGSDNSNPFHGFVVSIALVDNLQMNFHSPSEQQLVDRAESFCKTLQGRWALGDCGNSVIVFVWRHYKKMIIWPASLAERYITSDERREILTRVNDLIQTDRWAEALSQVIYDIHQELKGKAVKPLDIGTLSLISAVGVASLFTIIITLCVCAFRCCGNITPAPDYGGKTSIGGTSRHARYGHSNQNCEYDRGEPSELQRSLMKSPRIGGSRNAAPPTTLTPLNFVPFSDTTVV